MLRVVKNEDEAAIEAELQEEMEAEKALDREYWEPLKRELEEMRRKRPRSS